MTRKQEINAIAGCKRSCDREGEIMSNQLVTFPEGWIGPFRTFGWNGSYAIVNNDEQNTAIIDELTKDQAVFLAALMDYHWYQNQKKAS